MPLALFTSSGLQRRFRELQKYALMTHPFYLEDNERQRTFLPPHCYATSKEEEEIRNVFGVKDSVTRSARDLSAVQPGRKEESQKREHFELSNTFSGLDLQPGQARISTKFKSSNFKDIEPHTKSKCYSHLSSKSPDLEEVDDPEIKNAILESLGMPADQALGPIRTATAMPASPDGQAIPLDAPVAALADWRAAAHAELAIDPTAMPMPEGDTSTNTSSDYRYKTMDTTLIDNTGHSAFGLGARMDSSLSLVNAPIDSRPISTGAEFATHMNCSPNASRSERKTIPTNEHHGDGRRRLDILFILPSCREHEGYEHDACEYDEQT